MRASPITGVHFWFDRDVMAEPFLTLLDRTTQWIFNKSRLNGGPGDGRYLQLVISASYDLVTRSRQEIIDLCLGEVREVLPEGARRHARQSHRDQGSGRHVFARAGRGSLAPAQRTPVPNLFSPAIGRPPVGPPPWRAPCAAAIWRRSLYSAMPVSLNAC